MKNLICSLLARLFFKHRNFDFVDYTGLDSDIENDKTPRLRDYTSSNQFSSKNQ